MESYQPEELLLFTIINFKQDYVEEIFKHLRLRKEIKIPVSGHDLLELGLEQGPKIKEYLLEVRDQILRENISNRQQALEYLRNII